MAFVNPQKNIDQFGIMDGMHVADLGAGSGFYTLYAAKKVGEAGRVYAVDIQRALLDRLSDEAERAGVHNIEYISGDLERLGGSKLRDVLVDAAIVSNILFQIRDKDSFLKETYRIIKPGRKLLFVEWKGSYSGIGPAADAVITEGSAKEILERAGFAFNRTITTGDQHYGSVWTKPK